MFLYHIIYIIMVVTRQGISSRMDSIKRRYQVVYNNFKIRNFLFNEENGTCYK